MQGFSGIHGLLREIIAIYNPEKRRLTDKPREISMSHDAGNATSELKPFYWHFTQGGPRSDVIKPRKWHFNPFGKVEGALLILLDQHFKGSEMSTHYFKTIRQFDIAVVIGGSIKKVEEDKVYNIRFSKKRQIIYADLDIPESRWAGKMAWQYQEHFAGMVRLCMQKCFEQAKKVKGEVLDEQGFIDTCETAIQEFLGMDFSDIPIGRPPGVLPTIDDLRIENKQND